MTETESDPKNVLAALLKNLIPDSRKTRLIVMATTIAFFDIGCLYIGTSILDNFMLAVSSVGIISFLGILMLANLGADSDQLDTGEMRKAITGAFLIVYIILLSSGFVDEMTIPSAGERAMEKGPAADLSPAELQLNSKLEALQQSFASIDRSVSSKNLGSLNNLTAIIFGFYFASRAFEKTVGNQTKDKEAE